MKLVNLEKPDLPLLRQWLESEHVYRWFGEPEFWLSECEYEPNSFFMVEYEGEKIGFCRYTTQIPPEYQPLIPRILLGLMKRSGNSQLLLESCGMAEEGDSSFFSNVCIYFVDYGIGNQNYLGKGFGKKMLKLLCDAAASENDCVFVAASSVKNISSCNILKGNGFLYDEQSNLFLKIVMR